MDPTQILFVAIGVVGTMTSACALIGERRWHGHLADLRTLMLIVAALWLPATIDLIVQKEIVNAQEVGAWISDWWLENLIPLTTTTLSTTTSTTP